MIHTRPAFHSRKFTYTSYLVCYPYHLLPQRGFVPRSIWGLVSLEEDEEKERETVECRRSCGYTVDI